MSEDLFPESGLLTLEQACVWREELRRKNKKLVVTNGCFDLLHRGHVAYLAAARQEGDAMLVLINSDDSVRQLKGETRPVCDQESRAYVLCALRSVDRVVIFDGQRCHQELAALEPDVYVKGGDYTREKLDKGELAALDQAGSRIVFKAFIPGFSTTTLIERIAAGLEHGI